MHQEVAVRHAPSDPSRAATLNVERPRPGHDTLIEDECFEASRDDSRRGGVGVAAAGRPRTGSWRWVPAGAPECGQPWCAWERGMSVAVRRRLVLDRPFNKKPARSSSVEMPWRANPSRFEGLWVAPQTLVVLLYGTAIWHGCDVRGTRWRPSRGVSRVVGGRGVGRGCCRRASTTSAATFRCCRLDRRRRRAWLTGTSWSPARSPTCGGGRGSSFRSCLGRT